MTPTANAKSISWIVDAGNDFPPELRDVIDSWGTSCMVRDTPWRKTTRAWNGYDEHENRCACSSVPRFAPHFFGLTKEAFKYLTEKLQLNADSLDSKMLVSKSYHLVCSPERAIELIRAIAEKRRLLDPMLEAPFWVWEPLPDSCVPEQFDPFKAAMAQVDVTSPNHGELCGLFGFEAHDAGGNLHEQHVKVCTDKLLDAGVGTNGNGSIIVRAGKDGCLIARRRERKRWVPAFQTDQNKVKDPTGGGNAFCGAFAVTMARNKELPMMQRLEKAVVAGSVAASFAIEQVGMPMVSVTDDGGTLVNGDDPMSRFQTLSGRTSARQKS